MLKKEITYENAIKAYEKYSNEKINILKTCENAELIYQLNEDDTLGDTIYEDDVLDCIKKGNGIYLLIFQIYSEEQESFKDVEVSEDTFVFGEDYLKETGNEMYLEELDEEYGAVLIDISYSDSVELLCPISMAPPFVDDGMCSAGIAIFEDEFGDYEIREGVDFIRDYWGATFEQSFFTVSDLTDPFDQLIMILLDKVLVYE